MGNYKHGEYKVVFRKRKSPDGLDIEELKNNKYQNDFDSIPDGEVQEVEEEEEDDGTPKPPKPPKPPKEPKGKPRPANKSPEERDDQAGGWSGFSGKGKAENSYSSAYEIGDFRYDNLDKVVKGEGTGRTKDMGRTALNNDYSKSFSNLLKELPIFKTLAQNKEDKKFSNEVTEDRKSVV